MPIERGLETAWRAWRAWRTTRAERDLALSWVGQGLARCIVGSLMSSSPDIKIQEMLGFHLMTHHNYGILPLTMKMIRLRLRWSSELIVLMYVCIACYK